MGMYCTNKIAITTTKSELKEIFDAFLKGIIDWPVVLDIYSNFERKEISYTIKGYPSSEEDKQKAAMSKSYPSVLFHYTTDMEGECDSSSTWFCNGREGTRKEAESFRKEANQAEVRRFASASPIACDGIAHRVEIMPDGRVAACGENRFGECDVFTWNNIKQISCGNWHTIGLKDDGSMVACGSNVNGQCNVKSISGKVKAVSCGRYHTAILMNSGRVVVKGTLEQKATARDNERKELLSANDFPKTENLMLTNKIPGWEKMNDLIEHISAGDELSLQRSSLDHYRFEVLNLNGEKIGEMGFPFPPQLTILPNYIKVTAETVTPLSKRRKGSKYAQMTIKLEYMEHDTQTKKKDSAKSGEYKQTRVADWPKVERIKSVFDAVIGITSEGEIFIDGFCPLHKADIEKIMGK